jgi:hypothetical protein
MDQDEFDLRACMGCGGTMKCIYCKGKGERPGIIFKKVKTCKQCHGTGACPFCMGGKKSWALERMVKWIPPELVDKSNQLKRRELELRNEYERLRNLNIQVLSFEEFSKEFGYHNQFRKEVGVKIRIKEVMANAILFSEQMINDYESYLRNVEKDYRYGQDERGFRPSP